MKKLKVKVKLKVKKMKNKMKKLGIVPEESIMNKKMLNKKVLEFSLKNLKSDAQVTEITREEDSQLNLTQENLAIQVRDSLALAYPDTLKFDRCDEDGNILFELTEFEYNRLNAIDVLKEHLCDASIYIEEYKLLIISCSCGAIIGQIAGVEPDQAEEAEIMVRRLCKMYEDIKLNFYSLKYSYFKMQEYNRA